MSKHNKYRNNYELPTNEEEVVETVEVEEIAEPEEICETCQIIPEAEIEEAPVEESAVTCTGVVSGCEKLNVRNKAALNGNVMCVINKDDTVIVNTKESTDGWYKVCTEAGVEGFCMVQYITITE